MAEFHSINKKYEISIRETNSVCEDQYGFIWASSRYGIIRISANDCRIYDLPFKASGFVQIRLIYKNGSLIAYTNTGHILFYNTISDRFEIAIHINSVLNRTDLEIHNILPDDQGGLWVSSSDGFYRYDRKELTLIDSSLKGRYLATWYNSDQILIASSDGIWLFNTILCSRDGFYSYGTNEKISFISSLLYSKSQDKLWIGTLSEGLFCYDFDDKKLSGVLKNIIPMQPVMDIEEYSDSGMLVGIDGQGIWELDKNGEKVLNIFKEIADNPYSLNGNGVYDIFSATDGKIWVCTFNGGLSYFVNEPSFLKHIVHIPNNSNSLVNNRINSILEDHTGKIWFATDNGLSCWDIHRNRWKSYYYNLLDHAQVFLTLCEDNKGRIWAGSYSSGLYVIEAATGKELRHYSHPQVGNFIFDIFRDSDGDLWIADAFGKFACYVASEDRFRFFSRELVNTFSELSEGNILLGCSNGLSLLDKKSGGIRKLVSGYCINDILVLGDTIWAATGGDGIFMYIPVTGEMRSFSTETGFPSGFVNSMGSENGSLWLGTENGICRFNILTQNVGTFASVLPVSASSFKNRSFCRLKAGNYLWGTNNGALLIDTRMIPDNPDKGKIFIQDIAVSGRSVRNIQGFKLDTPVDSVVLLKLKYNQNNINLELLQLGAPAGCKFSWHMLGIDQDSTFPSVNRIINYTNIPAGEYILRIKLFNSSLSEVIDERSLYITVIPPFWRTVWFRLIILATLAGLVTIFLLNYNSNLRRRHTEEKIRFFTNSAHEVRTSLSLFKGPIDELNKENHLSGRGRYYLKMATEHAMRLSMTVSHLMDFQKVDVGKERLLFSMCDMVSLTLSRISMFESFARIRNITLKFSPECESYATAVDTAKMEKVVDNLISNAIKYSNPSSEVNIEFAGEKNKWTLTITDRGIGIEEKAQRRLFREYFRADNAINANIVGSGIGLLLVKHYVSMHNGKITCHSIKGAGSTFIVEVPYKDIPENEKLPVLTLPHSYPRPDEEHTGNVAGHKILIVEDNNDLLNFIKNILSKDFVIISARDGEIAREIISDQMPDIIVSDVMMPNMNGFELCKWVKSTYETSHIPFILLTALSEKAEQLHGSRLGADDYLIKPFDMNILEQRIRAIIHNREIVREKAIKMIHGSPGTSYYLNEQNNKFMRKIMDVAGENISNSDFDKDMFALEMNVSPSLLYKKMKALIGLSPTDFIKSVRLSQALELLQSGRHTITEVSELCGFASVSYFNTVFKKHYGRSPAKV